MGKYEKIRHTATTGLLIILLDQSDSMLQPYNDRGNRLEVSAYMINRSINNFIEGFFDGFAPKNCLFIYVIGYSHNVKGLCSGWLKDLDSSPLRYEKLKKKTPDGAGGIVDVEVQQPIWVEPNNIGGDANMFGAFSYAKELVHKWISDNPQYPVPVIINLSDGVPYYDGKDHIKCIKETTGLAKEIMSLSNEDGNVLIYNVQVGSILNNTELFSNDRNKLKQEETRFLFDISSEVPEFYLGYADGSKYYDAEIWRQLLWQDSRGLTNKIEDLFPIFPCIYGSEYEYTKGIHKTPKPSNDSISESIKAKWRKGNGYKTQVTVDMADMIRAKWRK